jgi:iron-sulfur cluster insertion protein
MKVTPAAHAHIEKICAGDQYFRVQVQAGGCSGFSHVFEITSHVDAQSDVILGKVCVDHTSANILQNAMLDWHTDLSGHRFMLSIPEATASCGCGKSFSLF